MTPEPTTDADLAAQWRPAQANPLFSTKEAVEAMNCRCISPSNPVSVGDLEFRTAVSAGWSGFSWMN